MESLRVPLTAVVEGGIDIDTTVAGAALQPEGSKDLPIGDVRLTGTLRKIGEAYLLQGTISSRFTNPCDRCLETADIDVDIDVLWSFSEQRSEPEDGVEADSIEFDGDGDERGEHHIDGVEVNLGPKIWEELVLAAPTKYLCAISCKGLCPQCGANLNEGPCGCTEQSKPNNSGLAELANLFPDIAAESEKE